MNTIFLQKKPVYDILDALKYQVIYLQDYNMYIVHESSSFYNPSNHIHETTITGKDITELFEHYGSTFTDKYTLETTINKVKTRTYTFDKSLRFCKII